jgi:hypothetical protein
MYQELFATIASSSQKGSYGINHANNLNSSYLLVHCSQAIIPSQDLMAIDII